MEWPSCQQIMTLLKQDESTNQANGKKYNRVIYLCPKDDVWITIEIPKKVLV